MRVWGHGAEEVPMETKGDGRLPHPVTIPRHMHITGTAQAAQGSHLVSTVKLLCISSLALALTPSTHLREPTQPMCS